MKENSNLIRVYSGTELTVNLLRYELEKSGIAGMIRNDFNSGVSAGFSGGVPSAIDLYIQELDLAKAEPIISEFREINNWYLNTGYNRVDGRWAVKLTGAPLTNVCTSLVYGG